MLRTVALICPFLFFGFAIDAADVDFVNDVRPIFERHCYECHGAEKQKSGLRLDVKSVAVRGGESWGAPFIAEDHGLSPLIELVTSDDLDVRMPPEGEGLSDDEVKTLKAWVADGAVWPDGVDTVEIVDKRDHWSFQPIQIEGQVVGELLSQQAASVAVKAPATGTASRQLSVDHFIDARLLESSLVRNPSADSTELLRRIHFDLTGLPPTPDEVAEFQDHPDVESLVDRLLASPRYGERWAQHWLDVIRWAETVGFETNQERRNAWPYRDWVIAAFNEDKPYDEFIFEQIAGDTVGEDAALGFLVAGPANLPGQIGRDEAAMRNARQDELDEVISTVSQAVLGLTVECARCHDHKFDPIRQADYYSMQAIFAGLNYGTRRWRGSEDDQWTGQIPDAKHEVAALRQQREALRIRNQLRASLSDVHTESFDAVLAKSIRMKINATTNSAAASLYEFEVWSAPQQPDERPVNVALAVNGGTPSASSFALANQSRHFENLVDGSVDKRQSYAWVADSGGPAWIQIQFLEPKWVDRITFHRGNSMPADFVIEVMPVATQPNGQTPPWFEVCHSRDRLFRTDDTRKPATVSLTAVSLDQGKAISDCNAELRRAESQVVRFSAGPQVYAASFRAQPDSTFLLHRGDAMQRREEVEPAVPAFLGSIGLAVDAPDVERRVQLAKHLTNARNPLTARVIVNRVWQHHFGTGLVSTSSDFGRMGTKPSHPELLDWLAARLIADGWSLKKLHRLILNSEAYRQSSTAREDGLAIDADSRLLWRHPPRRLEAEAIRDSMLFVSGKLNLKTGGPGFSFFNQRGGLSDYRPKESFAVDGWRRMVYAHKVRMISVDVFGAFDCPDFGQMKPNRTRSITPIQSLGLLNSPFVNRQASFFAGRLVAEVGDDVDRQVDRAFELAYSRIPVDVERRVLRQLATDHGLAQVCRAIFNSSEFVLIP